MAVEVKKEAGPLGALVMLLIIAAIVYLVGSYVPATKMNVSQNFPASLNLPQGQGAGSEEGAETGAGTTKYEYPITYSIKLVDPIRGNIPVSGVDVKVYDIYREGMTRAEILERVRDPYTMVYTNATTGTDGKATFPEKLFMGRTYVFTAENDSYYDLVTVHTIEVVSSPGTLAEIPGPTWNLYMIGAFEDIDATASVSPTDCFNITAHSGVKSVVCTISGISIGSSRTTTGVVKNPVLILRSPEGYELEGNEINSIMIRYSTGTDVLPMVGLELRGYIDNGVISLSAPQAYTKRDALYPGDVFFKPATFGVYEIRIDYNPEEIETGSDRLQICVDDLGAYKGADLIAGVGATPECYTITWTT